ncbi:thiol-disulfide oxidoreductase DCC family protein [Sagittula sp. SSi028]|uniref:thiol-disulfide oxidoreductase DCC family protein n=1 Tax=Sagittula sp. SSi028 TaxID=3400636 RepID=UPI003AF4B4C3
MPKTPATPEDAPVTVYYDGSCPLCSVEIGHYEKCARAGQLAFVDVSQEGASLGADLDADTAMRRFHVRQADGALASGAAGFVALWAQLPRWRWLAKLARLPGVTPVLEGLYRGFLPLRPRLSRIATRLGATPRNPSQ